MVMEIVFVHQCEVLVCLDFVQFFSPLAAKLIRPRTGCRFFKKNFNFSITNPLKSCVSQHTQIKIYKGCQSQSKNGESEYVVE